MKELFTVVALFIFSLNITYAQTLTTAETLGKGKKAIFFSTNALHVKEFATLKYSYVQFVYGVTNRVDLYLGPAFTTVFGRTQGSLGIGANTNLYKGNAFSVSTYNLVSVALNSRNDGSTLIFSSQVISKNFKAGGCDFSGYAGYSFLAPIGKDRAEKLFTPPRTFHFVPMGVMLPVGKRLAIFAEYNHGNPLRTYSVGLSISP